MQLSLQEPVSQSPDNQRARKAVVVYMQGRSFNSFASNMIKLSVNETKRSSLLARPTPLLLIFRFENLISGPKRYLGFRETGPWPWNLTRVAKHFNSGLQN